MRDVGQNVPPVTAESGPRSVDRAIRALAARQHAVVTRAQLRSIGLADSSISQRAATGRLHRLHTGVYSVGHTLLTQHGRWMAAVLACGPDATLSHSSAAALWGLRRSATATIDVTVPRTGKRSRARIRIHRPRTLHPDETTTRRGIPVTTPARTILDVAATLRQPDLEHVLDRMEILELTDYPSLAALARAHAAHRGAHRLLGILDTHEAGTNLTRSGLEILFRHLCHDHGLPQPRVNTTVEGQEVDFLFEARRLIVETDSWRYHKTRRAFENDRARDAVTTAAGYRTLRFTDRQLTDNPNAVAATLTTILEATTITPPPAPRSPRRSRPPPASAAADGPRRAP